MIGTLLTFLAVGLASLIVAGIVLWIAGTVFSIGLGLASFLLLKVAPIVLLGWIVMKVIDRRKGGNISAADRRYLEGE